jgi:hypothetical protein
VRRGQINEFKLVVRDKSKPVEERRFALRFLVHCLEDMHQTMHVGDNRDRGGNDTQVRFFDKATNVHQIWDSDMLELGISEDFLVAELLRVTAPEYRLGWTAGTVEDWATGRQLAARSAYLVPGTDQRIKPGEKLGKQYLAVNVSVALRQLALASVRLAFVLNSAFAE